MRCSRSYNADNIVKEEGWPKVDQEASFQATLMSLLRHMAFMLTIQLDKSQVAKAGKISMLLKTSK